jgi:hypothetical protein
MKRGPERASSHNPVVIPFPTSIWLVFNVTVSSAPIVTHEST